VPGGLLGLLDERDRADLCALGRSRRFRAGASLIVQGDDSQTVFVLLEGHVKVVQSTPEGREIVLAVRVPGDLLGEFEAIDPEGGPRVAANVALEAVEALAVTGAEFRAYADGHPRATAALLRWAIRRLRAADRRRSDAGTLDVAHRLVRLLDELADQHGLAGEAGVRLDLPLTQDELASLIAASRDSVVRALGSLRRRGLVSTSRRAITIPDRDALRAEAAT
jgi:CRP-like cAMP-binding protein